MKHLMPKIFIALIGFSLLAGVSASQQFEQELSTLQREWAQINTSLPADAQAGAFKSLAHKAGAVAQRYPDKVEPRIWEAIILSSYAQAVGKQQSPETLPEILARIKAAKQLDASGNPEI